MCAAHYIYVIRARVLSGAAAHHKHIYVFVLRDGYWYAGRRPMYSPCAAVLALMMLP